MITACLLSRASPPVFSFYSCYYLDEGIIILVNSYTCRRSKNVIQNHTLFPSGHKRHVLETTQ